MEAEKENMQSGFKPLRRLTSLRRHRPENDMSVEDFMRWVENPSPGLQQPMLKQNRSIEKTVKRRELQPTNVQEVNSVQNEQRESGQEIYGNYQPRMPMSNLARRRSVQADIPHGSKSVSGGDPLLIDGKDEQSFHNAFRRQRSVQADISHEANSVRGGEPMLKDGMDEQNFHNPFRRLGHRRRSSLLSTHEDAGLENNAFAPSTSALTCSFQPSLRRRSKQLMQNIEESPQKQEEFSSQQANIETKDFYNRRRSARLMQLDNISEKREPSSYLDFDKNHTEREFKEKPGILEEKESFNRLATSQFSKNMKLITSNSKPVPSPHVASSNTERASKGTFLSGGKKDAFEKVRHLIEKAREQRKIALLKSNSKATPRMRLTPLRLNQASAQRRGHLMSSKRKQQGITQSSGNQVEERDNNLQLSKECCRTLQFESGDEGDGSDNTEPLDMMDITNMISGSSILQGTEEQVKQNKPPAIKKNLMQISTAGLKRQNPTTKQKIINQDKIGLNEETSEVQDEFKCAGDFESEWSQDEDKLVLQKNVKHDTVSKRIDNDTLNKGIDRNDVCNIPEKQPSIVKVKEEKPVTKVAKLKTPTYKIAPKSSRAVNPAGVRPVIGRPVQRNQTHRDTKIKVQGRTPNIRRRSTKDLKVSVQTSSEPSSHTVEVQTSPAVVKSDASTNTQIKYTYGRSLDPKLMSELETLSKEQDEIAKEALLIRERTAMRQKRMREDGILDSFAATISPLKRLKAMMQEKKTFVHSTKKEYNSSEMGSQSQINKSVQFSETSIFYEAPEIDEQQEEYETPDTSIQMCNSLNASMSHWNSLKGSNSFLQTPVSKKETIQSAKEEREEFLPPTNDVPGEKSPFTELAGNCERPSLAPLTPHSRKEVSVLKLALRKQLEQLYD
ncbi:uncharacterized protein LOC134788461 [Penaeus indicus]|uniref:uncharacterized protein LOC134788461 n=1 Tax=Penaeus indicus TaxID=29960 RepID=UPI00300D0BE1